MKTVKTKESFEEISKRATLYLEADQRRLGVWSRRVFVIDGHNLFAYRKKGNDGSLNGWPILGAEVRVRQKYADWNERAYVLSISKPHVYNLTIAFDSLYEQAKFLKSLSCSGCTVMGVEAIMLISKLQDFQRSTIRAEKKISEELDCRPKSSNLVPKLSIRMVDINWKFGSGKIHRKSLTRKSSSESNIGQAHWIEPTDQLSSNDSLMSGSTLDVSDGTSSPVECSKHTISSINDELLCIREESPKDYHQKSMSEDNLASVAEFVRDGTECLSSEEIRYLDVKSNNSIRSEEESQENEVFLHCTDYQSHPKNREDAEIIREIILDTSPVERRKSAPDSSQFDICNIENSKIETEPEFKEGNAKLIRKDAIKRPQSLNPGTKKKQEKLPLQRLFGLKLNERNGLAAPIVKASECESFKHTKNQSTPSLVEKIIKTYEESSKKNEKDHIQKLDIPENRTTTVSSAKPNSSTKTNKVHTLEEQSSAMHRRKIGFFDRSRKPHAATFEATKIVERNTVNKNIHQYENLTCPSKRPSIERNAIIFHANIDRFERFVSKCRNSVQELNSSSLRQSQAKSVSDLCNIFETLNGNLKEASRSKDFTKVSY